MIFLNNSGYSSGRTGRPSCRSVAQFGSISRNSELHNQQEESDTLILGLIVASFGIAITLGK